MHVGLSVVDLCESYYVWSGGMDGYVSNKDVKSEWLCGNKDVKYVYRDVHMYIMFIMHLCNKGEKDELLCQL